jgi:hypothetical protein
VKVGERKLVGSRNDLGGVGVGVGWGGGRTQEGRSRFWGWEQGSGRKERVDGSNG